MGKTVDEHFAEFKAAAQHIRSYCTGRSVKTCESGRCKFSAPSGGCKFNKMGMGSPFDWNQKEANK